VIKKFSDIFTSQLEKKVTGCFLDTSILVAATYDLDLFHDETAVLFDTISDLKIDFCHFGLLSCKLLI
jgi:hypothetical protein